MGRLKMPAHTHFEEKSKWHANVDAVAVVVALAARRERWPDLDG